MGQLLFGYRHVSGVPTCPCGDPGNYLCGELPTDNPLEVKFVCWCGRSIMSIFDTVEERDEFLRDNCGASA